MSQGSFNIIDAENGGLRASKEILHSRPVVVGASDVEGSVPILIFTVQLQSGRQKYTRTEVKT